MAIVGPTASGKSRLGMDIAQGIGGEIIGADSRQVYRHMDIGTAKPPLEDLRRVRHHLIDIIDPSDDYSVALYVRQAREAIEDVQRTWQGTHHGGWDRTVCSGPYWRDGTCRRSRPTLRSELSSKSA